MNLSHSIACAKAQILDIFVCSLSRHHEDKFMHKALRALQFHAKHSRIPSTKEQGTFIATPNHLNIFVHKAIDNDGTSLHGKVYCYFTCLLTPLHSTHTSDPSIFI